MSDNYILRWTPKKNGFDVFEKYSDGREMYLHSLIIEGPISNHYIISNVIRDGPDVKFTPGFLNHVDIAHSMSQALYRASNTLKEDHLNIIDETGPEFVKREKESQLVEEAKSETIPSPHENPHIKDGRFIRADRH